jgi:hypothetical protein
VKEYTAIVLQDYPGGKHYASWVEKQIKTIETRMKYFKHRGDIVICCATSAATANAGKALCIVSIDDAVPMTPEHEKAACIESVPGRVAYPLSNWRWFSRKFHFTKRKVRGTFQGTFTISIPDDVTILNYNPHEVQNRSN